MSSKLHRRGKIAVEPFVWNSGGARKAASGETRAPADLQPALDAAFQKGLEAAAAEAEKRAAARVESVLRNFAAIVQELTTVREQLRRQSEEPMVRLAVAIARRVLHREISTDPEAILGLIRAGLDRLQAREKFRLRLAAADAAVVREHRGRLGLPDSIEIAADNTLTAGSAVFETERGEMDASLAAQLEEIEHGLTDVLRRRR
jgi:flagellar assembly protein FliH